MSARGWSVDKAGGMIDCMDTALVSKFRAVLDAVEARALLAGGDAWTVQAHSSDTVAVYNSEGEPVVYDEGSPTPAQMVHIAEHDPASVLADIAAKRKLIERGGPFCTSGCDNPDSPPMNPDTDWTTPLEHHLDCGAYEAVQILAKVYNVTAGGSTV